MSLVFLFVGQGSQKVGAGAELIESSAECRHIFETADHILGFPLTEIMMHGSEEQLVRTEIAQPALLTLTVAQARYLISLGVVPTMLAGHSLGQYAALVIAGSFTFEEAVDLVATRGQLMQQTIPEGKGAMMAIVGLTHQEVETACEQARTAGIVGVACHNAPTQTVISGTTAAVELAADYCEEEGGGVVALSVSVPFHCDLLTPMVPAFSKLVHKMSIVDPQLPVIDNVTACPLSDATAVQSSLVKQITRPVLFEESLYYLANHGATRFIQCGPGKSLLSFAKRSVSGIARETFDRAAGQIIVG